MSESIVIVHAEDKHERKRREKEERREVRRWEKQQRKQQKYAAKAARYGAVTYTNGTAQPSVIWVQPALCVEDLAKSPEGYAFAESAKPPAYELLPAVSAASG